MAPCLFSFSVYGPRYTKQPVTKLPIPSLSLTTYPLSCKPSQARPTSHLFLLFNICEKTASKQQVVFPLPHQAACGKHEKKKRCRHRSHPTLCTSSLLLSLNRNSRRDIAKTQSQRYKAKKGQMFQRCKRKIKKNASHVTKSYLPASPYPTPTPQCSCCRYSKKAWQGI